jgi:signal peptidase II
MRDWKATWRFLFYPLLIAAAIIIVDQWAKLSVLDAFFIRRAAIPVTPFFNIVFVLNKGVSFGMLDSNYSHILAVIASCVVLGLLFWLWRTREMLKAVALGLLIGGAIGNIIDRIRIGAVVDFLDFYVGHWHWPAFNVADSAVVSGVALLMLQSLVFDKKNRHLS